MNEKIHGPKPHMNIGTIGHVDHGKTTFSAAITYVLSKKNATKFKNYADIDSGKEEKKSGITINATHVEFETDKRHYSLIDCPGHRDYVKNMITGASQMEGAILLVSAETGLMEQTFQHLLLAWNLKIKHLIVFLNKADLVDEEQIELVKMDIQENLTKYGYKPEKVPIIEGSALMALEDKRPEIGEQSILKLLKEVDNIPTPERVINKPFLMYISGFFKHPTHGVIVSGKIEKGILTKGDKLEIIGFGLKQETVARSIEMHHASREQFFAGDDVAICIKDIDIDKLAKGQALVKLGDKTYASHTKFKGLAYISSKEEGGRSTPFESNYRPQFYMNYGDVTGIIQLPDDKKLERVGQEIEFTVKLISDMVIEKGNNFLIREGEKTVVGSGTITEVIE